MFPAGCAVLRRYEKIGYAVNNGILSNNKILPMVRNHL